MDVKQGLEVAGALAPILTHFMKDIERSDVPGAEKKAAVLELTEAVYRGAQRTGALDGVKELRGVEFALIAPLVSVVIDAAVVLYKRVRLFFSRSAG